jgi:hypothetical protein
MQHINVSVDKEFLARGIAGSDDVVVVNRSLEQNGLHSRMSFWRVTFGSNGNQMRKDSASGIIVFWREAPQNHLAISQRQTCIKVPRMCQFAILNTNNVNEMSGGMATTKCTNLVPKGRHPWVHQRRARRARPQSSVSSEFGPDRVTISMNPARTSREATGWRLPSGIVWRTESKISCRIARRIASRKAASALKGSDKPTCISSSDLNSNCFEPII